MVSDAMMPKSPDIHARAADRFIAVLRRIPHGGFESLIDRLLEASLTTVEVTMDSDDAISSIRFAASRGAVVGAGTVRTVEQVRVAQEAGAVFLASPVLDEEVVDEALSRGVRMLPGCLTPTEVARAVAVGCTEVKIFPASSYGPAGIKSLKGPFPDVGLVVTGGIGLGDVGAYLQAGAKQVGVGIKGEISPADLRDVYRICATQTE